MTTALITGADGFVGRNLCVRLGELDVDVIALGRNHDAGQLAQGAARAGIVFHLAGVNRPPVPADFTSGNVDTTIALCAALAAAGNTAPVVYTSSTQAEQDNPYGRSKRAAEDVLFAHARGTGAPALVFRLPNIFGKWARPNYNSAVATFCHNIAHGLPITLHDPASPLSLAYIDDVIDAFVEVIDKPLDTGFHSVTPIWATTVGEVATIIRGFPESRKTGISPRTGTGLVRALYSTYLSYLEPAEFDYGVPVHGRDDPRGIFVEMLKTPDAGQFSYFVAHPGVTRGDHYHHTKTEKFLVISGQAHFGFRHIDTGQTHELVVCGGEGRIVETIPGWTHNITNIGDGDMVCMLWANEIFDRARPDTVALKV